MEKESLGKQVVFVVATSLKEARDLAPDHGITDEGEAYRLLREVKKPPTDHYYASLYKVWRVLL